MLEAISDFFNAVGQFFSSVLLHILQGFFELVYSIFNLLFGWFSLPAVPDNIVTSISSFFDLIFNNLSILSFFVRPSTLIVVVPIVLILLNFEWIYKVIMWIIRKIPFLSMK